METIYIPRMVNLTEREFAIIQQAAGELGFGKKGFSAALRYIVREWEQSRSLPARQVQQPEKV